VRRHSPREQFAALQAAEKKVKGEEKLAQIAAAGNAAQKALLADVTEKNPDALYVELLRLFEVRRSVADGRS
jgi:hypothetical protein